MNYFFYIKGTQTSAFFQLQPWKHFCNNQISYCIKSTKSHALFQCNLGKWLPMTVYLKQMNCYWSYYGISPKTMRHFLCKTLVPWLSSLLQLGSTWMNGPNFWRSRRSSVKNLYKKFSWGFEHVAKNPSSCKSQCRFSKISHGNEIIWTWSNENEAPSTLSHKNDASSD